MSKPILDVKITSPEEKSSRVKAVFDSGSFFSVLRQDKVPPGAATVGLKTPRRFRAAGKGTQVSATAEITLVLAIGGKEIEDAVLISPDLTQEMLVGAGTMQKWDISILNRSGRTEVTVGRDMHDPELTGVDSAGL
ncbi:MAG: hypothetical protein HY721_04760 [Planctomycetes bacterium]|nr:hypothetical protein [Planctomycetota bacterium]